MHAATRHDAGDHVIDARLHEENEADHVLSDVYELGTDNPEFEQAARTRQPARTR